MKVRCLQRVVSNFFKFILWLILFWPIAGFALHFPINNPKQQLVGGRIRNVQMGVKDTFSTIAQRFDLGYYPLFEINPNADPDNPQPGSVLLLPTKYILPQPLSLQKSNIVVNLAELRLYYYSAKQHRVYIFPVGIGKEGWMTPLGHLRIVAKIANPTWVVPESIRKFRTARGEPVPKQITSGPNDPLGYYALRLSDTSYLIHGTDDPVGVGRRSSAGCIRMYGKDIKQLFAMAKVGTPVTIIEQPYKVCVLGKKLYFEAHLPLYEQRLKLHGDITPALNIVTKLAKAHKLQVSSQQILVMAKQHLGVPRLLRTWPYPPKKPVKHKSVKHQKAKLPRHRYPHSKA